jgi:hypothetical protein
MEMSDGFKKVLGGVLVGFSVLLIAGQITMFIALFTQFFEVLAKDSDLLMGGFLFELTMHVLGWILAVIIFRFGRKLYRSA